MYTAGVAAALPPSEPHPKQHWQRHPLTCLLVAIVGVMPLYALSIISGMQSIITGETPALDPQSSLLGVLLVVGVFGTWILVLLYFVCGESLASLQLKPGRWNRDITHGIALGVIVLLAMTVLHLFAALSGSAELPAANRAIATALANNKLLLLIWVGPVAWLQAALLEELYRVFLLSRLWIVWPSPAGRLLVVCGSALLFGLGHAYQGPLGMAGTTLIGGLLGIYYLRRGRVVPMIIAHGIYDTVVLCSLALLSQNGLI